MIEIRKLSGNSGWYMVNVPAKYVNALGLKYGSLLEIYMVDRLTLVMRKHQTKPAQGLLTAAKAPPIDLDEHDNEKN